jgi:hypothetical protein
MFNNGRHLFRDSPDDRQLNFPEIDLWLSFRGLFSTDGGVYLPLWYNRPHYIGCAVTGELIMSIPLWIAFAFLAALVVFLGVTVYFPPKENVGRATLKFFTALSAGFSGGFFTGDALFAYQQKVGGAVLSISGAAGCALFFTVWFVYPSVFRLDDAINLDVPASWTFRNTVETVAGAPCDYVGFLPDELGSPTRAAKIRARTPAQAILQVRLITAAVNAVRPYEVEKVASIYRLVVRIGG